MDIPNGLLLKIQSSLPARKAVGNTVLGGIEQKMVYFRTTGELREAMYLQGRGEIRIIDSIPANIKELLDKTEDVEIPAPAEPTGYVSRKEFEELKSLIGSGQAPTTPTAPTAPTAPTELTGPRNENTIFETFEIGGKDMLRVEGFASTVTADDMANGTKLEAATVPYLGELKGLRVQLKSEYLGGALQFSIFQGRVLERAYGLYGSPLDGGGMSMPLDAVFSESGLLVDEEVQFPMPPNAVMEIMWLPRAPGPDDVNPETGELNPELVAGIRAYGLQFALNEAGGLIQYGFVGDKGWGESVKTDVTLQSGEVISVTEAYHVDAESGDFVMVVAGIVIAIVKKREIIQT